MKLYAATNEYQDILLTTIRDNLEDCIAAAIALREVKDEDSLYSGGDCIAEFENPNLSFFQPILARGSDDSTRIYVRGFRTENN